MGSLILRSSSGSFASLPWSGFGFWHGPLKPICFHFSHASMPRSHFGLQAASAAGYLWTALAGLRPSYAQFQRIFCSLSRTSGFSAASQASSALQAKASFSSFGFFFKLRFFFLHLLRLYRLTFGSSRTVFLPVYWTFGSEFFSYCAFISIFTTPTRTYRYLCAFLSWVP